MENRFTCEVCGGTEYYIETGFCFCKECQAQAIGFREAVFETPEENVPVPKGKRVSKAKKKKQVELSSTYETYNYILFGLVNEFIAIGAKKELKLTVKYLWFKYLEKLEVISTKEELPKLAAVYSKV